MVSLLGKYKKCFLVAPCSALALLTACGSNSSSDSSSLFGPYPGADNVVYVEDGSFKSGTPLLSNPHRVPSAVLSLAAVDPEAAKEKADEVACFGRGDDSACLEYGHARASKGAFDAALGAYNEGCEIGNLSACLEVIRSYEARGEFAAATQTRNTACSRFRDLRVCN